MSFRHIVKFGVKRKKFELRSKALAATHGYKYARLKVPLHCGASLALWRFTHTMVLQTRNILIKIHFSVTCRSGQNAKVGQKVLLLASQSNWPHNGVM